MWDWWGWSGMGWWMLIGMTLMVVFWGGLIFLIVWAVKRLTERGPGDSRTPLGIARERYARGEITREQYEQLKKDLAEH